MFEIKQEKNEVLVTVSLKKRILNKDPKIYIYAQDALREAKKHLPELNISNMADNTQVASTVRVPHEVTWRFKIIEKEEQTSKFLNKKTKKAKNTSELVEDLTSDLESATIEETTEKVQEPTE